MSSNPATIRVTVDDFSKYIANKFDFYDAMVANGYYMPKYKSTMITDDFMRDIQGS
jgi:spore coat protein CotF